jgi:hypothetical protein
VDDVLEDLLPVRAVGDIEDPAPEELLVSDKFPP